MALGQQIPPFLMAATSAFVNFSAASAWSNERATVFSHEAVARWHASNRPSIQAAHDEDDVAEFTALPMVTVRTVRVRYRDAGMLPPMNLEDEVDVNE